MNALRTMEDAVNLPHVPTYLAASNVPVIMDSLAMDLRVQVRNHFVSYWPLFTTPAAHIVYIKLLCLNFTLLFYWRLVVVMMMAVAAGVSVISILK